MNCFSQIKLILVLIHLKYSYCNSPYAELSYLPHHLCQILPQPTETLSSANLIMFFIGFNILSNPIRPQATTSIGYTKSYINPSQSKFVIKLYTDHDTLWVKHATHLKAEFLRTASSSNLDNNGRCSFIFTTRLVDTTNAAIFTKKQFLFFSQFSHPYFTLTCLQDHPYNPH